MITQKALVSTKFRMESSILNQIGEHRPQLKIRHDHWVPFVVMTGLRFDGGADTILNKCVNLIGSPLGYYRLPLQQQERFPGWQIPASVKEKTIALCKALNEPEVAEKAKESGRQLTLHWERDEYRFLIEEENLNWPSFVEHKKLKLLRNRYPIVPGFDPKTRSDRYEPPEEPLPLPTSPKDFLKKPTTWKVKNVIPKEGIVHRYASKFGKSYPIMRKTAETSKYAKLKK